MSEGKKTNAENLVLQLNGSASEKEQNKGNFKKDIDIIISQISSLNDDELSAYLQKTEVKNVLGKHFTEVTLNELYKNYTKDTSGGFNNNPLDGAGKEAGKGVKAFADGIAGFSDDFQNAIGLDKNKVGNWGHLATGLAGFMALGAVSGISGAGQKLMSGDVIGAGAGVFGVVKSVFTLGIGVLVAGALFGKEKDGPAQSHNRSDVSVGAGV